MAPKWPPTWPVAVDPLFERQRCTEYGVLATAITLAMWMLTTFFYSRTRLGSSTYFEDDENRFAPLYWALYADCDAEPANSTKVSGWSQRPCSGSVTGGFIYEVLFSCAQFLLEMVMLQTVNNPWRSKIVFVWPAVFLIMWYIYDHGKLIFKTLPMEKQLVINGKNEGIAFIVFFKGFEFVMMTCWIVLAALLVKVLWNADDMGIRNRDSLEWARRSLGLNVKGSKRPSQFQEFATTLRGACRLQFVPACADAALKSHDEQEQRGKDSPPKEGMVALVKRMVAQMFGTAKARVSPDGGCKTEADGTETGSTEDKEAVQTPGESSAESPYVRPASLDRLPSMGLLSLVMSAVVVLAMAMIVAQMVLKGKFVCAETAYYTEYASHETTKVVGMSIEATAGLRQGIAFVNGHMEQVETQSQALTQQFASAANSLAQVQLSTLPPAARQEVEAALAALQPMAVGAVMQQTNAQDLLDHINTTRTTLNEMDAGLAGLEQTLMYTRDSLAELTATVDKGVKLLYEVSKSMEVTGTLALGIAFTVAVGVLLFTWKGWKKQMADLRSGRVRESPYWSPGTYHPIKAPMLPGMMTSTVFFAFLMLWLVLFLALEAIWMAPYVMKNFGIKIPVNFILTFGSTTIITLVVKKLLLDKVATYYLTKNGFVTRWAGYAWFVTATMPFYALVGLLGAIFRFIFIAVISFLYMGAIHITILPPWLQSMDAAYVYSWSMLVTSHRQVNPMNYAFARAFVSDEEGGDSGKVGHELKRTRAQKNWKMAVTLARNPSLSQMRAREENKSE